MTAMILCAGFGTRLGDLTKDTPKPMLLLNGTPLLEHTIRHLTSHGVERFIINVHYLAERITSYFGDGEKFNVAVEYRYEEKPLGTAGAVKNVEDLLSGEDDFFVLYGDVLCDEDYRAFHASHRANPDACASIIVHERAASNSVVEMDSKGRIMRFIERPTAPVHDKRQPWVNSGLYCFRRSIFELLPARGTVCDFPKDIFPVLVERQALFGKPLSGFRIAIDSPERHCAADHAVMDGTYRGAK